MNNRNKEIILVTGCAGFIGMHLSRALLKKKYHVIGIDNLNNYYDVILKIDRIKILKKYDHFEFNKVDISIKNNLEKVFKKSHR